MAVRVEIAKDGMQAWLEATRDEGAPLTVAALSDDLKRAGVVAGIDAAVLAEVCSALVGVAHVRRLVASGTAPLDGADGRLDLVIRDPRRAAGTRRPDGRVDFKDHGEFLPIERDQLLARLVPPVPGKHGRDVRGKRIEGRTGRPASLPVGDGTKVVAGGTELRAKRAGVLRSEEGRLSVDELLRVPGNLGYGMGNIDCRGSVVVAGDVLPGFHIRAGGDVRIDGSVERGEVTAGGSIVVREGVVRGSRLRSGAEVRIGHLGDSYVEAGTDVTVAREALHGTINAAGGVRVPGRVVGGVLRAGKTVEVGVAGRAGGEHTELCAGVDPVADVKRARLVADVERLRSGVARLDRLETLAPPEKRARLAQARAAAVLDLRKAEEALAAVDAANAPDPACTIRVEREAHPDVHLRIGPSTIVIETRRGPGKFRWEPRIANLLEVTK